MSRDRTHAWVQGQCDGYRRHLLSRGLVPEAEIDEVQPAEDCGPENFEEWIIFYGQCRAWLWVQDDTPTRRDSAEERVLKALREAPEAVTLSDGRRVNVYPKSLDALLWFRERDRFIQRLNRQTQEVVQRIDTAPETIPDEIVRGPARVVGEVASELAYQIALVAAVASTPGPRLPEWAKDEDDRPPRHLFGALLWKWAKKVRRNPIVDALDYDPVDLLAICQAFRECNAGRMGVLKYILPPANMANLSTDNRPFSFDIFIGSMAMKLGTDPEYLAKNRSVVSLMAQAQLGAPAQAQKEMEDAL